MFIERKPVVLFLKITPRYKKNLVPILVTFQLSTIFNRTLTSWKGILLKHHCEWLSIFLDLKIKKKLCHHFVVVLTYYVLV